MIFSLAMFVWLGIAAFTRFRPTAVPPAFLTMSLLRRSASALFVVAAFLLLGGNVAAQAGGPPASLKWAVAPSLLPPGAMIAVISGNPAGSGRATIALSMPDGYKMPSHFHPSFERVEVTQGTLLVGMGDRLDAKQTLPLTVGDTILAPAGMHHFSIAKGPTVVAVTFMAPYTITYVKAYQAPRQPTSFPYGY
jgi:quercetin dioxygenase-like cupin family protein